MSVICLNNAYIYNDESLKDYLRDKGFSEADINTAKEMLYDDTIEEYEWYKKEYKNMERCYEEADYALRSLYNEVEELCEKLKQGKGGTKAVMADKIMKVLDFYVQ